MTFKMPETEQKADYVRAQFDRIANRYDLCNNLVSLGMHNNWKNEAVKALNIKPGGNYLDVCCGTGDLTFLIAKHMEGLGYVTGLDFSSAMLDIANLRFTKLASQDKNLASIAFVSGDAQNLPFEDKTFDGAIISFGLRNLTDFTAGLKEIKRVLNTGARLVNLDLNHPKPGLFTTFYQIYFNNVVPVIGEIFQGDRTAYTYLPKSLDTYPDSKGIKQIFTQAGLANIEFKSLAFDTVGLHWGDNLD